MPPLRRALVCLLATSALAACHTPASNPQGSAADGAPRASAQQAAPQPQAHAAGAPDAGGGTTPILRRPPLPANRAPAMPTPSSDSQPPAAAQSAEADAGTQTLLLKDSGVRCITFPCPSYSVQAPGAKEPTAVTDLDLSALGSDEERERVQQELQRGVRVEGSLSVRPKAGPAGDATVLRVTRVLK